LKFKKKMVSRIKELREALDIPQQELASRVGVSRQTIYYLEKGTYNPKLTLSFKLKNELNTTIEDMFKFEPIINDIIGNKTLDDLDLIHSKYGIEIQRLRYLRDIDESNLAKEFSKEELKKISKALGMKFEELFED